MDGLSGDYSQSLRFLSMYPPQSPVKFGSFCLSEGNAGRVTSISGYERRPTITLQYNEVTQAELDKWVLFHSLLVNDTYALKTYMNTLNGQLSFEDSPFGMTRDYNDILDTVYVTSVESLCMSYAELYTRFQSADDHQFDMIKNYLIEIAPGHSWSHGELVNYSYWKLVISFSIIEGVLGQSAHCSRQSKCDVCGRQMLHYPMGSKDWIKSRLVEIVGQEAKAEHYLELIWAVRQGVRHVTAHTSAHPTAEFVIPAIGDTIYDTAMAVGGFRSDNEALEALVYKTRDVARILLLNHVFQTGVFPDIKEFTVRVPQHTVITSLAQRPTS